MATDHYTVLGVPSDADPTVIKRRYRLLVRQNHPDTVAPDERDAAHERMLLINAAWTVLSDPAERARYDRGRQARPVSSSTPGAASGRRRVDGWVGGAATAPGASQSRPHAGASTRRTAQANAQAHFSARGGGRRNNPRLKLLTMVFEAAELYFFHGRVNDAIEMCNRVLQFDPRSAEAAALLGDIYAEQGRRDLGIAMYERAVRNQPDNALYRQKWEALRSGAPGSPAYSPYAAGATSSASTNGRGRVEANGTGHNSRARTVAARSAASSTIDKSSAAGVRQAPPVGAASRNYKAQAKRRAGFGYGLLIAAAALVTGLLFLPAEPASVYDDPSTLMLALAGAAGCLTGGALPLVAMADSVYRVRSRGSVPGQMLFVAALVLAGIIMFPLALVVYVLFSVMTRSWNLSLLAMLGATLFLSSTLALPFPGDNLPVLEKSLMYWSGRVVFPATIGGWFVGSLFKR